jgi:hypothetical protein
VNWPEKDLDTRVALLERMADDLGSIVKDHEKRLRWNERVLFYGMGVIGVSGFVLNVWARLAGH